MTTGTAKIVAGMLAGLALVSGGCVSDDFWAAQGDALAASIIDFIIRAATGGAIGVL